MQSSLELVGRKKINIEEIKDDRNRQVCFGKRKLGLLKKALELSILCRCEIGIVVFSSNGTLHQWSSPRSSLSDLLQRYSSVTDQLPDQRHPEKELLEMPSDLGSEADDDCDVGVVEDHQRTIKRKRAHGGSAMDTTTSDLLVTRARARTRGSASPEPDVAGVPSSLDQRLNAAAKTCALTPRSEKALSCISQEFDQLFSQLATASDGAASQGSLGQQLGASPGISVGGTPVGEDANTCSRGSRGHSPVASSSNCGSVKPIKAEPKTAHIAAWATAAGMDAILHPPPPHCPRPAHAQSPAGSATPAGVAAPAVQASLQPRPHPPAATVPFAPSTTSAFSVPVKPTATSAPRNRAVFNQPMPPSASSSIHHSSGSAFMPALGALLGPRFHQQPALQMAVVPIAVPSLGSCGDVAYSAWPGSMLPQAQPGMPAAYSPEQFQELLRHAGVPGSRVGYSLAAGAGPSIMAAPMLVPGTSPDEQLAAPMQLAMGLST